MDHPTLSKEMWDDDKAQAMERHDCRVGRIDEEDNTQAGIS